MAYPAAEPKDRALLPKPPREVVRVLALGAAAADLATWVRPVALPTFLLSAVR